MNRSGHGQWIFQSPVIYFHHHLLCLSSAFGCPLHLVLMRFLTSVPFLSSRPSPCPSFSPIPTYSHAFRLRLRPRPVITTHPRLTSSNLCLFPYCFSPHSYFNLGYNLLQFLSSFTKLQSVGLVFWHIFIPAGIWCRKLVVKRLHWGKGSNAYLFGCLFWP